MEVSKDGIKSNAVSRYDALLADIQGAHELLVLKAGHLGVPCLYVCLSRLWLGGLFHLSFLSDFLKLVCYAHVFPCT